jgi:tetratricopeptide (TPR) repeat protein
MPHAHDDDALRAVRAAMEIHDATARLGEALGLPEPLRVRIGINSGFVVVGAGPADQFLASGTPVNLAARLQAAAEPGEILAGETTRSLTSTAVSFGPARSVEAKGFAEPVRAWPVVALSVRSARRTIPMIGRRRELTMLRETLERARETSRLHLVTVLGEPGIGKTRLVEELLSTVDDDVRILRGRAGRFEEDALFASIAEMLRHEIGAEPSDARETMLEKLSRRVGDVCMGEDAPPTIERLALALGIGAERATERPYRLSEVRAGLIAYLAGLTRAGAAVIVAFEDLELAPADLLELIEQIGVRGKRLPVVIVCAGRDEMLQTLSGWPGGVTDAMTLRLEPLSDDDAVHLARSAAGDLTGDTAERIALHAGGNPFFIVETTAMLIHERTAPIHAQSPALPATVHAVVAARIDHLDAAARDVVRKASVFPRSSFYTTDLAMVVDASDEALRRLEDEELLVRDRDRPEVWRFQHQMVRDVAYESLAKRERLQLHLAVADRLADEGRYPAGLAHHLELAARASLDLDPADRSIAERAVDALRISGDIARRRMESRTAIDRYQRALGLAGPGEHWGEREARVLCGIGEAQYWLGDFKDGRATLEHALTVAPGDTWTLCVAHRFIGDIALNIDGDVRDAEAHFDEALDAARRLDTPDAPFALARTLLIAAWAPYHARNDLARARAMFEEAMDVASRNPEGDPWAIARALTFIASLTSSLGSEADALPLIERALEIGRSMKDPFTTAVAQHRYGVSLGTLGKPEEAIVHLRAAASSLADLDARWETASALGDVGETLRHMGLPGESEAPLREALAITRELGDRQLVGWIAAELARALRALGRSDEARQVLGEAATQADLYAEIPALKIRAMLAVDEGDLETARTTMEHAVEVTRARGLPNSLARIVWFAGRLLGPKVAGGEDALQAARKRLEEAGWMMFLDDPDLPGSPSEADQTELR